MAGNERGGLDQRAAREAERPPGREQRAPQRPRDRLDETRLPTPPLDPWLSQWYLRNVQQQQPRSLDEDEDMLAFFADLETPPSDSQASDCPSRNSTASTITVPNLCLEEAFEHLNRLYSLTEQILELRHRTSTFFKRVRNLEKLKVLRNANRALEDVFAADYEDAGDFCEEDTGFADSLLNAMISNCREPPFQRRNVRVSASRRARGRFDFQKQSSGDEGSKDAPKVSKWTRVKAAFKWERAYANDAAEAAENATAPTSPITPTARFLSVPEIEAGNSGSSSPSFYVDDVSDAGTSFSRTSTVSLSNEAACECARKRRDLCPARGASPDRNLLPGSLGGTQSHLEPRAKEEPRELRGNRRSLSLDRNVATDAEQANDNGPAKQIRVAEEKNGTACPSNAIDEKGARSTPKRPPPSLTITIPSLNDDIRCVPSPESNSSVSSSAHTPSGNSPLLRNMQREQSSAKHFKRQQSVIEESIASRIRGQDSKWSKVRRAFLTNSPLSIPPSPVKVGSRQMFLQNGQECSTPASCSASAEDLEQLTALNTQSDTQRDYRVLREKLGAEFHRKLVEWERMKNLSPRPQTKDSVREAAPSFANPREHFLSEERLSFEFRKKLQDWKRVKKERRGSNAFEQQRFNRRRLTDWQLWKSPAKAECRNREIAGQRANFAEGVNGGRSHLSEDFLRKMDVWKRMHETGNGDDEHSRAKFSRLGIGSGIDETEFLTLEKALAQFNRDTVKQRRETDRQQSDKFVDANAKSYADAARDSSCTDEVLVQTSAGSYRFEGISREFTRKLYDWEKYRGISPRSSTFRLLGPAFDPLLRESDVETPITPTTKAGSSEQVFFSDRNLTRSKSADDLITRSSLSESFIRRPTSLQLLNRVASTLEDSDVTGSLLLSSNRQGVEEIAEDILMDDSEPEAMIVDIEDVIEETASPLKRMQPHQTPVYSVAASETTSIAVPLGTVTSSHEPSPVLFIEIEDKPNRKQRQDRRNNSPRGSDSSSRNLESANASSRYSSSRENVDSGCTPFLDVTNRNKRRDDDSVCFARDDDVRKDPGKASDAIGRDRTARIAEMSTKLEEPVEKVEAVPAPADERRPVDGVAEEQRLDGSDECETVRRWNLGTHSAFARSVKESTDLSSEEKHCREDDDDRETVEDGGSCLVRDVAEVLAEPDNEYENVKSGEDPYYCSLVDRRPATNYETCDRETFSGSLATYKLESANYENLRHANQENEDPSPNLSKPFNLFKIKSSVFERIPFESHAKRLSPGGRNKSPEAATPIKSKLSSDQLKQRKLETTSTPISPSKSPCNGDYNRNQTTRATPPTINEDARPKSTALSTVKGCTGSSKALHRSIDVPAEIDAAHIHDPGSTIDDPRALNNDAGRAIEEPAIAEKPKKQYSPTRNVLMKTKRMIFSPFRREEDYNSRRKNSNSSDSDQAYSLKTIAKSRSTSPKINRPDMLTRMSFSLPWPLGSSSKDHESKAPRDGPEIAYKSKRASSLTSETDVFRESRLDRPQGATLSEEAKEVPEKLEDRSSIAGKRQEKRADGSFDPNSSDLMHKLQILSSVVAKRDGRSSISEELTLESRSLRMRRAKEDFLSRRGGPLFHSVMEPSTFDDRNFSGGVTRADLAERDGRSEPEKSAGASTTARRRRVEVEEAGKGDEIDASSGSDVSLSDRAKSASTGMINVDPDIFQRLTEAGRGCESLPRTSSRLQKPGGSLAKIVNKCKFIRLICGKEQSDLSTIARLCRQSLLIDIKNDFEKHWEDDERTNKAPREE